MKASGELNVLHGTQNIIYWHNSALYVVMASNWQEMFGFLLHSEPYKSQWTAVTVNKDKAKVMLKIVSRLLW